MSERPAIDPMHWGQPAPDVLRGLAQAQAEGAGRRALPPIDRWNPDYCGEIDMRIARDGTWFYLGTPIGRPALVRLFSTILRREPDGRYVLVTPVEKVGIAVEDVPFIAVAVEVENKGHDQRLRFLTNVGDEVVADADHHLRVTMRTTDEREDSEPQPYVHVRGALEARLARPVFYELVAMAEERRDEHGQRELGVRSSGHYFALGSPGA
jgi:hypothetical protein